ncbi:hypothetical protein O4J56_14880 [Nocardiopsis sp. RSe5-2]|uniref:Uncharacterized protein n=1 Tax=Nocardiopsis endophytica TaxID=3018445 RepID=A0ABT4U5D8_9ACTN|nr:hypothetical protein [Nocardiopsis endophytica]MDA2811926.1 hypothetical protein [Nocardiopsis endophytica]
MTHRGEPPRGGPHPSDKRLRPIDITIPDLHGKRAVVTGADDAL